MSKIRKMASIILSVVMLASCGAAFAEAPAEETPVLPEVTAEQTMQPELALVLAAPVLGTAFPLFHHFRGGKGIAVTFGCLLGLLPLDAPLIIFVGLFLFFSLVVRVQPHFYRTIVVYLLSLLLMVRMHVPTPVCTGFGLISLTVCYKLHRSKEIREKMKVQILWKH